PSPWSSTPEPARPQAGGRRSRSSARAPVGRQRTLLLVRPLPELSRRRVHGSSSRMLARVLPCCARVDMAKDRRSFLTHLGAGVTVAGAALASGTSVAAPATVTPAP